MKGEKAKEKEKLSLRGKEVLSKQPLFYPNEISKIRNFYEN